MIMQARGAAADQTLPRYGKRAAQAIPSDRKAYPNYSEDIFVKAD